MSVEDSRRVLPKVSAPRAAVALLKQRTVTASVPVPASFAERRQLPASFACVPDDTTTNTAFSQLHAGYMALRMPAVLECSAAAKQYIAADNAELCCTEAKDASAPPRRLSITLLFEGYQNRHSVGWSALDALTLLSSNGVVRDARFAVAAGDEACILLKEWSEKDKVMCLPNGDDNTLKPWSFDEADCGIMVVRWPPGENDDAGVPFTVLEKMRAMPSNLIEGAKMLQKLLMRTALLHCRPVPASVFASITPMKDVEAGIFEREWVRRSKEFCDLTVGDPAVTRRCEPGQPMTALRFSGEFVRLCPRQGAVDAHDSMHAMLLCATNKERDTRTFVTLSKDGLGPPHTAAQYDLDIHILCVSVLKLDLRGAITLFGPSGVPGAPINQPFSWIVQLQPSLWPLSAHLCERFFVVPCAAESWRPKEEGLVPFAAMEASMAADLYTKQFATQGIVANDVEDNGNDMSLKEYLQMAMSSPNLNEQERVLLAALQLPLVGGRAKIGDVYAQIAAVDQSCALAQMLLYAACHVGSNASVVDAFELCTKLLKCATGNASEDSIERTRHERVRALVNELAKGERAMHTPPPDAKRQRTTSIHALSAECRKPSGGVNGFMRRLIRGMEMVPVTLGSIQRFQVRADANCANLIGFAAYVAELIGIGRRLKTAVNRAMAIALASALDGSSNWHFHHMFEIVLQFYNVDAPSHVHLIVHDKQDDTLLAHRFVKRDAVCIPFEAVMHAECPLVFVALRKPCGLLSLTPWQIRSASGVKCEK